MEKRIIKFRAWDKAVNEMAYSLMGRKDEGNI